MAPSVFSSIVPSPSTVAKNAAVIGLNDQSSSRVASPWCWAIASMSQSEIRHLAGLAVQLDQVRPLDLPKVGPCTSLVDPQERVQRIERAAVDIESVGQ